MAESGWQFRPSARSFLRWSARWIFGISILALVISRIDISDVSVEWGTPLWLACGAGVALICVIRWLSAVRWSLILDVQRGAWGFLFHLYMLSAFFSLFLPTAIGGDVVRAVGTSGGGRSGGEATASVVLDRFIGLVALAFYGIIGGMAAPDVLQAVLAGAHLTGSRKFVVAGIVMAVVSIGAIVVVTKRGFIVPIWLTDALSLAKRTLGEPARMIRAFGLSLLIQGLYLLVWMILARGIGLHLGTWVFLIAVPVVSLASMLPLTIGGLGVREGTWVILLSRIDAPPAEVLTLSLIFFGVTVVVGMIGGVMFALFGIRMHGKTKWKSENNSSGIDCDMVSSNKPSVHGADYDP